MAEPIQLEAFERDILVAETQALIGTVSSPASQAIYTELLLAVQSGSVPENLLGPLERVLELGLRTGRVRKIHSPQAAKALQRLFDKTPAGTALSKSAGAANEALQVLCGHVLEEVSFSAAGPGVYGLTLSTDRCRVTLEVSDKGIWVKEVGLGI